MIIKKKVLLYKNDYDFSNIKKYNPDEKLNKVIDIIQVIMNNGFAVSNPTFYNMFHELIGSTGEFIDVSETVEEWSDEE